MKPNILTKKEESVQLQHLVWIIVWLWAVSTEYFTLLGMNHVCPYVSKQFPFTINSRKIWPFHYQKIKHLKKSGDMIDRNITKETWAVQRMLFIVLNNCSNLVYLFDTVNLIEAFWRCFFHFFLKDIWRFALSGIVLSNERKKKHY